MILNRSSDLDFAEGFMYTSAALLIPMPESSNSIASVAKPFQILVIWAKSIFASVRMGVKSLSPSE